MYCMQAMLRVSDIDDATARRRDRERAMLEEGEALWRAKQRQQWISRLQEQREARDMLLTYSPWGRPGCGAPNTEDPRKKKLQDILGSSNQNNNQGALTMGRPGCGAPLRTRSGRLQTVVRVDPMIRFLDPSRRCIDNEIRYRASPHQQLAYRTQLDHMVMERRKAQAEARKGSTQELRHMLMAPAPWGRPGPGGTAWRQQRSTQLNFLHSLGWSSDPTLCAMAHSVNFKGKVEEDLSKNHTNSTEQEVKEKQIISSPVKQSRLKAPETNNNGAGLELVPILARRRGVLAVHHPSSRHPLCSTDITRHDVPGIPEPKYHEDRDYLQALRGQVASKQKKLEEMKQSELETSQQHFETWRHLWGRPGHGAPKLPVPRMTLTKLLSSDEIPPFKPPR